MGDLDTCRMQPRAATNQFQDWEIYMYMRQGSMHSRIGAFSAIPVLVPTVMNEAATGDVDKVPTISTSTCDIRRIRRNRVVMNVLHTSDRSSRRNYYVCLLNERVE